MIDDLKRGLQDLLNKRANLFESEAKPLIEISGTRAFNAEEQAKSDAAEEAMTRYDRSIALIRSQIEADSQRDALGLNGGAPAKRESGVAAELRSVLVERTKGGTDLTFTTAEITRALTNLTAADGGGNTIPSSFWGEFVQPLRDQASVIDAGARVIVTASGEDIKIPRLKTFGAAEKGKAANAALAGTDPTFDQVTWSTTKYDQVILTPRELVEDSAIDIEGLVGGLIGQNIGLLLGSDLSTATATAATLAVTGAGYTPTYDELVDLLHSVARPYRKNGAWLANDLVIASIRKLKDSANMPVWQPSVQADQPDMLLGKPIHGDAFLDAPAAGTKYPLLFGDYSRVWVRMVGSLRIERSDQAAFLNDQIAFKGVLRAGSALTDANAVKSFKSKVA